jgi:hypothetical protein
MFTLFTLYWPVRARYDGPRLRAAEERRAREREVVLDDLRKRFVSGPVLVLPGYRTASSGSASGPPMTPIPGVGMVMPSFITTAEWARSKPNRSSWFPIAAASPYRRRPTSMAKRSRDRVTESCWPRNGRSGRAHGRETSKSSNAELPALTSSRAHRPAT